MSPYEDVHSFGAVTAAADSSTTQTTITLVSSGSWTNPPHHSTRTEEDQRISSLPYDNNNNHHTSQPHQPHHRPVVTVTTTVLMILAVGWASRWEWTSQQHGQLGLLQTRQALRLMAVSQLEQREGTQLQQQAVWEREQALQRQDQAQTEQMVAERDAIYAVRLQNHQDYYQHLAAMEQLEAQQLLVQSNRTALYIGELQRNMTLQLEGVRNPNTTTKAAVMHPGWCDDNAVFETVCHALGGSLDLKPQDPEWMEQEKMQLQHETVELAALEQREYLQQLVAELLQERAQRFHDTATELQHQAQIWQAQAATEQAAAQRDASQAQVLQQDELRVEQHVQQEQVWQTRNHDTAVELWNQAAHHGQVAYRYAIGAVVLAVVTSLYFVPRVVLRAWKLLALVTTSVAARDGVGWDDNAYWGWHALCYSVMHCILFVLVVGLVDRDYWLYLTTYYNLWQRAVIVTWFAYLTSGVQTVLLHTVPHVWAVWTTTTNSRRCPASRLLRDVALQFLLRLTVTFVFCLLEFLILWLTPLRTILWAPDALRLWSCGYLRFTAMILLAMYIAVLEQPSLHDLGPLSSSPSSSATTDPSTLLLSEEEDNDDDVSESDSEVGSELSPLQACVHTKDNNNNNSANRSSSSVTKPLLMKDTLLGSKSSTSSSSATNDLPHIYFRNMQRAVEGSVRRQQQHQRRDILPSTMTSRYAVNLPHEWWQLTWTVELLMSVCSWCILQYGVAVAYAGHPWNTILVGTLFFVATIMSWLWWWYRSESDPFRTPVSWSQVHGDRVVPEKVAVYGSLTV